ncbi:MAG: PBP1A family penicillin-binding protein [Proteobacteria bacterium]|nr:PBP1A family penicillin-binding protein [Pseudomonadota bacterium]
MKQYIYKILRIGAALSLTLCLALAYYAYQWLNQIGAFHLEESRITSLKHISFSDNSLVFDRSGNRIGEFFNRYQIFASIDEIPKVMINAILAIEDRQFYKHKGVDFSALTRATISRIRNGKITQGGSTITQQITKQLILTPDKTIERKVLEIFWALKMEKILSKSEILEIYTNALFLGNGAYGVAAASRRYFGKDVRDLKLEEAALIAGLFQSPSRYNPAKYPARAKKRQKMVLNAMQKAGYINKKQLKTALNAPLQYVNYKPVNYETAPWFVDWVRDNLSKVLGDKAKKIESNGLRIYTTLDPDLQIAAESSIKANEGIFSNLEKTTYIDTLNESGKRNNARIESAMLVTDPTSGDILAMVGGRSYKTSQFNRTHSAMRSPGSSFKPIVYAQALLSGMKWSDVIFVSPVNIDNYKPRTPESDFLTETTMLRAFYRSMNTPTIEIANKVGINKIIQLAKNLGMTSPIKNELGSALGSSDTTMFDLARVYGTFTNKGRKQDLIGITKIETSDGATIYERPLPSETAVTVVPEQLAFLINEGMRSVLIHGTGHNSSELAAIATGKTGTSNESSDNWFCGSTANTVATVWVGTDEHVAIPGNVTGGGLALPIWDTFLRKAIQTRPAPIVFPPKGVYAARVDSQYGNSSSTGVKMWFFNHQKPQDTESPLQSIQPHTSGVYRRVFSH